MAGIPLGSWDAEPFHAAKVDPTGLLDGRGRFFIGALAVGGGLLGQVNLVIPGMLAEGVPSAAYSAMLLIISALGAGLILLPRYLGVITALLIGAANFQVGLAAWASAGATPVASPVMLIFPMLFSAVLLSRWLFLLQCIAVVPIAMLAAAVSYDRPVDWVSQGLFNAAALVLTAVGVLAVRRQAENSLKAVRTLSLTDPLTGLANRRRIEVAAHSFVAEAERSGHRIAALVLDLDHFKSINDEHGHAAGDQVLREVATTLRGTLRANDLAARTGGEEFLVLAHVDDPEDVRRVAERLRAVIAGVRVQSPHGRIRPTCSLGVAVGSHTGDDPEEWLWRLVDKADGALYSAKRQGRDKWVVADLDREQPRH